MAKNLPCKSCDCKTRKRCPQCNAPHCAACAAEADCGECDGSQPVPFRDYTRSFTDAAFGTAFTYHGSLLRDDVA
jgi:hypothetical protein